MNRLKYFIYAIFASTLIGCSPSDRALKIAELSGDPNVGEVLYNEMCSRCHGVSGRGGVGLNLIEHRDGHEDAELIDTVLEGGGGMPSFKRLEDQEIADIISHIRAL